MPGKILIYTQHPPKKGLCEDCVPLVRRIVSVEEEKKPDPQDVILHTEFVAWKDIWTLNGTAAAAGMRQETWTSPLEPVWDCAHSGGTRKGRSLIGRFPNNDDDAPNSPPYPTNCQVGGLATGMSLTTKENVYTRIAVWESSTPRIRVNAFIATLPSVRMDAGSLSLPLKGTLGVLVSIGLAAIMTSATIQPCTARNFVTISFIVK